MGYNLYVTRKNQWHDEHGEEIQIEDWIAVVKNDPEMEMRSEAHADLGNGQVLVASDPTMAVWLGEDGAERMWFYLSEGNAVGKSPRPDGLAKMHSFSLLLAARLIGEEGETYDAEGNASYPQLGKVDLPKAEPTSRPWWRFW